MIKLFGRSQIMTRDETLRVLREGSAVGVDVEYVDGLPRKRHGEQFTVRANVQPITGKQLLLVPEGDRLSQNLALYIPAQSPRDVRLNDLIRRRDAVYVVHEATDWGSYTWARIVRQDVEDVDALLARFAPLEALPSFGCSLAAPERP